MSPVSNKCLTFLPICVYLCPLDMYTSTVMNISGSRRCLYNQCIISTVQLPDFDIHIYEMSFLKTDFRNVHLSMFISVSLNIVNTVGGSPVVNYKI